MLAILVLEKKHVSVLGVTALLLGVFILYAVGLWLAGWIKTSYMIEGFLLLVVSILFTILGLQLGLL